MHPARTLLLRACCLGALVMFTHLPAAESADAVGVDLTRLKNSDMAVRIEALRAIQTSIDPRIPAALLPLLSDEGNSIRRLAARGVGSRWWQIPKDRWPDFNKALQKNARSEDGGEQWMARRALSLLNREFRGEMVSRSPNQRWVIYERHNHPCLIDTKTGTEELLGWPTEEEEEWLGFAWGNDAAGKLVTWHEKKEAAVLQVDLCRHSSTVWIWQHGYGLTKLGPERVAKLLGFHPSQIDIHTEFAFEVTGRSGDEFRLALSFARTEEGTEGGSYVLAWNIPKRTLRVVSRQRRE